MTYFSSQFQLTLSVFKAASGKNEPTFILWQTEAIFATTDLQRVKITGVSDEYCWTTE